MSEYDSEHSRFNFIVTDQKAQLLGGMVLSGGLIATVNLEGQVQLFDTSKYDKL